MNPYLFPLANDTVSITSHYRLNVAKDGILLLVGRKPETAYRQIVSSAGNSITERITYLMDINNFYKQARQWKKSKDEQARDDDKKRLEQLEEAWRGAKQEIRKTFPLEGAQLFETEPGQTSNFPFSGGNYQFDLVLPNVEFTPVFDEQRSMKGVIRCVVNCYVTYSFKLVAFYVWVDGSKQRFENSFEAFLACCNQMGYCPNFIE